MWCPLCGKEVFTTGLYCPSHISIEYDSSGNIVARTDMVKVNDWYSTTVRIPMVKVEK